VTAWRFAPAPVLIAGPCVVEEGDLLPRVAERLAEIGARLKIAVCFKASFDKANRARLGAARGPGMERGLALLAEVRRASGLAVLTDVHEAGQVPCAAEVADALQVPAFLCRQTDLLVACGRTGKPVNLKKGQWMQPEGMGGSVEKVRSGGTTEVAVTERAHIPALLAAAAAAGADGFFLETHPDPARAPSDAATQWPLDQLEPLLRRTLRIWHAAREEAPA
jgi:2-dehydro-3-deoxyphosphooctonate aldolase (KDO 8-P synthase)